MQIQFTKWTDGAGVFRYMRDDGSSTWQTQTDRHAAYFALHDLPLLRSNRPLDISAGYERGFFDLIVEGWDIEDTTGQGVRGRLPAAPIRELTEENPANVRKRRGELYHKWTSVRAGEKLELRFE